MKQRRTLEIVLHIVVRIILVVSGAPADGFFTFVWEAAMRARIV
jgi:hypothetical protein